MEVPFSVENLISKGFSKISREESSVCSCFSLKNSPCICEENRGKCPLDRGYVLKNALEKTPSKIRNPDFGEQFGDNSCSLHSFLDETEYHAITMSSADENLETGTGILQEHLKRIDEKVERIGFHNIQKRNRGNNMRTDMYYQWFEKNYIMEEKKSRLESTVDIDRSAYSAINCSEDIPGSNCEKYSVEDKSDEYSRDVEDKEYSVEDESNEYSRDVEDEEYSVEDKSDEYSREDNDVLDIANAEDCFQMEVCPEKRQVNSSLNVNLSLLSPRSDILSESLQLQEKYENNRKDYNLKLLARNMEILKEIMKYLDEKERNVGGFGEHDDYKYNKIRSMEKNTVNDTFKVGQISKRQQKIYDSLENVNEVDKISIDIANQKANFVIFTYRVMCLKFERAFIRPYANVLALTFELISFIFFLFACVFFFIFDRIHFLITNQRWMNLENSSDNSDAQQSSVLNFEEPTTSCTLLNIIFNRGNILTESEETAAVNLTRSKNENIEKCLDINSWIKVDPKEIDIVSMKCDSVAKNITNLHENVELSSTVCCREKQHRATIRTSADFVADFNFINGDENEESELVLNGNEFDMEVIASSEMHAHEVEDRETNNSYDIGKYLNQYGAHSGYKPTAMSRLNSFLSFENSFRGENPLFNSTGYKRTSIPNHENSLYFDSLDMTNDEDCFQIMQECPRKPTEEKFDNSSLSVNLSTISTNSDILSESVRIQEKSENLPDDYDHEFAAYFV